MRRPSARELFKLRFLSREVREIIHGGRPPRLEKAAYCAWKHQTLRWNNRMKAVPYGQLVQWAHEFVELHGRAAAATPQADEIARVKLTAFYRERADAHPNYGFGGHQRQPGYIKPGVGANTVRAAMLNREFDRKMAIWAREREERRKRWQRQLKVWAFRRKVRAAWRRKRRDVPIEPEPTIVKAKHTYETRTHTRAPLIFQEADTRMRAKVMRRLRKRVA